ncbi:MAG: RnfABCDGE type electron transport complex subunit B [Oscillospiraceae bacterium]|jgi:Na+-translocating ferredoxin:NAD+ oxidoreductase RNF subunit RnfB|nr:RnfABCDGE type electron transport complex subunit B [Oscillospiraceae bacterium]
MLINILFAVLVLGILGLLFGIILAVASKLFEVKTDERLAEVLDSLPGANCGACGFAGCSAYAQAIIDGKAEANLCSVGGEESLARISGILGIETQKNTRIAAFVNCSGGINAARKFKYVGLPDCHAAMRVSGGPTECTSGCLGLGSCVKSCQFGAIKIRDGVAFVDHELCTGCLKCVNTCPKKIIRPVPYFADVNVACSSHERGSTLRRICNIGCIGCRICEKFCPHGAVKVVDNLAQIDYNKCTGCGECAVKCPRKLIADSKLDRIQGGGDGDSGNKAG